MKSQCPSLCLCLCLCLSLCLCLCLCFCRGENNLEEPHLKNAGRDKETMSLAAHNHVGLICSVKFFIRTEKGKIFRDTYEFLPMWWTLLEERFSFYIVSLESTGYCKFRITPNWTAARLPLFGVQGRTTFPHKGLNGRWCCAFQPWMRMGILEKKVLSVFNCVLLKLSLVGWMKRV